MDDYTIGRGPLANPLTFSLAKRKFISCNVEDYLLLEGFLITQRLLYGGENHSFAFPLPTKCIM